MPKNQTPPVTDLLVLKRTTDPIDPAVYTEKQAIEYVASRARLFCLIYRGYLEPFTTGNRNISFLKRDLDTALRIAKHNRDALGDLPRTVSSVTAAVAACQRQKKLDCRG